MSMTRNLFPRFWMIAVALAWSAAAHAQAYPSRPIRLVVTSAPAGTTDTVARLVSAQVEKRLRATIVVDNRGGAGGIIGTDIVANAPPDGYTLLHATAGYVTNAVTHASLPYDILKDLVPITDVAVSAGYLLLVSPALGVSSIGQFIKLVRAQPDRYAYASPGHGHVLHLAAEMFDQLAGIRMIHVPYKGVGPELNALVAGEVQAAFVPPLVSMPLIESGKVRALAFTGERRWTGLPSLPTVSESALPGYHVSGWQAWFAPGKTPLAILKALNEAVRSALREPSLIRTLETGGYETAGRSLSEARKLIESDLTRYREIARKAGLKVQR
jgi:tripartite-type tricarboxylate transporter receptor subunit TctC